MPINRDRGRNLLEGENICVPGTSAGCGAGVCNEQGSSCACATPQAEYDMVFIRGENCFMTSETLYGIFAVLFIATGLSVIFALHHLRGSRKIPRKLCLASVFAGVTHLITLGLILRERKLGPGALFFLATMTFIVLSAIYPLILFVYVSPLMAITMSTHRLQGRFYAVCLANAVYNGAALVSMWTLCFIYENDTRTWNIIFVCFQAQLGLWGVVAGLASHVLARKLIKHVGELRKRMTQRQREQNDDEGKASCQKQEANISTCTPPVSPQHSGMGDVPSRTRRASSRLVKPSSSPPQSRENDHHHHHHHINQPFAPPKTAAPSSPLQEPLSSRTHNSPQTASGARDLNNNSGGGGGGGGGGDVGDIERGRKIDGFKHKLERASTWMSIVTGMGVVAEVILASTYFVIGPWPHAYVLAIPMYMMTPCLIMGCVMIARQNTARSSSATPSRSSSGSKRNRIGQISGGAKRFLMNGGIGARSGGGRGGSALFVHAGRDHPQHDDTPSDPKTDEPDPRRDGENDAQPGNLNNTIFNGVDLNATTYSSIGPNGYSEHRSETTQLGGDWGRNGSFVMTIPE